VCLHTQECCAAANGHPPEIKQFRSWFAYGFQRFKTPGQTALKEVVFCLYDQHAYDIFAAALKKLNPFAVEEMS
jgi:hypothetical protein